MRARHFDYSSRSRAERPEEPGPRRRSRRTSWWSSTSAAAPSSRPGKRLFDFGLGDPKEPTPAFIREALARRGPGGVAVPERVRHRRRCAAPRPGTSRAASASTVDPETQVLACAGAKEAIFHLPLAFAGDPRRRKVVMPDPGYPTYEVGARFAGLEPVKVPLTAARRFLLEPEDVGEEVLARDAVFWVSYPHNPTGAVAPRDYLAPRRATPRAGTASSSPPTSATPTSTSARRPPRCSRSRSRTSLAIHSCSKRSGMTGYRSGFVAGDPRPRRRRCARCAATPASPRPSSSRPPRRRPGPTTRTPRSGARSSARKRDRFLALLRASTASRRTRRRRRCTSG